MSAPIPVTTRTESAIVDCWNRIGVRGDKSCPELEWHVHCHNCPVYSAAASSILNGAPSTEYTTEWTAHFAAREPDQAHTRESVVIFRIGSEWLSLPTRVVKEVAAVRRIHSLPQRRGNVVLGVANVHGELLVCVSLNRVLGLEDSSDSARETTRLTQTRLLVIRRDDVRTVCPVDEVSGIRHIDPRDLMDPPLTAKATAYSKKVLSWENHAVGVLDDQLLFYTLKRSLA